MGAADMAAEGSVPIDFVQRVDREIIRNLSRGYADLAAAADALGISSRTLQRRLVRAGTSYQHRLDEIRKVWAQQHLASGQISLTELSQLLGFGDLSTFSDRFKGWFGMSPRAWRKARAAALSQ
jgi:AraC-like DNA-binding protein